MSVSLTMPPLLRLSWFLIFLRASAQSGCQGETTQFDRSKDSIKFKNLCDRDITADVDFAGPTVEKTFSDCLNRCVEKVPLCYGFDFTPYGCWLKNGSFSEDSAKPQSYVVDAAMLTEETLAGLSSDCKTLGLLGCYNKNGRFAANPTAPTASSTTLGQVVSITSSVTLGADPKTATSTPSPGMNSQGGGLSTGAKIGLGAGFGVIALLAAIITGLLLLKRRKRRAQNVDGTAPSRTSDKMVDDDPLRRGLPELQGQNGPQRTPDVTGSSDPQKAFMPIHEIDSSARYER